MRKQGAAGLASSTELTQVNQTFGMPDLWRAAIWGVAAASALVIAAFASTTAVGIDRLMQAAGQLQGIIRPAGHNQLRPLDAREGRRLAEAVSQLTDDRERLLARLTAVEHSVENVTGSVARMSKAVEEASKGTAAAERPAASLPAISVEPSPADESTASVNPAAGHAAERLPVSPSPPAPEPESKPEFGLDIGGGSTIEGLRTLWAKARQQHAAALEGLRPVVHLRESRRAGGVELRLVAGPLPSAAAAAKLCATLNAAGAACRPAVFDGQRLAAR
jgi:hypothetical protein